MLVIGLLSDRRLRLALASPLLGAVFLFPAGALAACPNEAARQGPSAALPDCRAYEQVTPSDKGDGGDLFTSAGEGPAGTNSKFFGNTDTGYPTEDGDQFLLQAPFSSFGTTGESGENAFVFARGDGGWTGAAIASSNPDVQSVEAKVFNPTTFSEVGVQDVVGPEPDHFDGEPSAVRGVSLIGSGDGADTTMASTPFQSPEESSLVGSSGDLSHVVLESRSHELAPGDEGQDNGSFALYEWHGGGECSAATSSCSLINANSDGSLVSPCGAMLGQGHVGHASAEGGDANAVSSDGARIFFTAPDPGEGGPPTGPGCWQPEASPQVDPPQLYMREENPDGTTKVVDISGVPEAGVTDPTLFPAVYVGADKKGNRVFFVTETELTADDTSHAPELYEDNTAAPEGERLTRISGGASGTAVGNVDFVPAVSDDGAMVYFAAFGDLAPGATALEPTAEGQVNLYRYDTTTRTTTYVAKLGNTEYPMAPGEVDGWYNEDAIGAPGEVGHTRTKEVGPEARANWYTTADGRYLVFASYQELTGYDNAHAPGIECNSVITGLVDDAAERCTELFRYSVEAEEKHEDPIVCVSCGPPGVSEIDDALFARSNLETPAGVPPRPISEDGSYVFFDTANALVPQASNARVHVYEWHDGTISLIGAASDASNAFYLGSTPDGSNVFFGTHAQLVPGDTDQSGDLYDARIDGGFAGVTPAACTGTGCQGVPDAPPVFATPSSATFEGVGNFPAAAPATPAAKPKKCRRGFVKKRGRCVTKKSKKSTKGRK